MTQATLATSDFNNLYVDIAFDMGTGNMAVSGVGRPTGPDSRPMPLGPDLQPELERLARGLMSFSTDEFPFRHDGLLYRVTRMNDVLTPETHFFHLRRGLPQLQGLGDLFPTDAIEDQQRQQLRLISGLASMKGLILWVGPGGSGKTTTAAGSQATWLTVRGGVAVMLSQPPEFNIPRLWPSGNSGRVGLYIHEEVPTNQSWSHPAKKAVRAEINYLLINEIREPEVAAHAIQLAQTGMLVSSTIHGEHEAQGIERYYNLLHDQVGDGAGEMLANTLQAIIWCERGDIRPELTFHSIKKASDDPIRQHIAIADWNGLRRTLESNARFG